MSTRTNQMPRCAAVRCERSSRQFLTAIKMLAAIRTRNSPTNRYFHEPSELWSSVFPIRKSQISEIGFGMPMMSLRTIM